MASDSTPSAREHDAVPGLHASLPRSVSYFVRRQLRMLLISVNINVPAHEEGGRKSGGEGVWRASRGVSFKLHGGERWRVQRQDT